MIFSTIKALVVMLVIISGWLLIQGVWRRAFPGTPFDEDVLAGRIGCHHCPCDNHCENEKRDPSHTAMSR